MDIEPTTVEIEALHLVGQLELQYCMGALATLAMLHPHQVPTSEVNGVLDKLLDRHNDLNMETP